MAKIPAALSVRDVHCSYQKRSFGPFGKKETKEVLRGAGFEMEAGEIFGLTGDSGCGKTTLARCILGLVDYKGEITVDGQGEQRKSRRGLRVQMVFQDPGSSLNPAKKAGWLLEEPLVIHGIGSPNERAQKADQMFLSVGLDPSYRNRRVHELSVGQKQRICIGRALILEPRILIADEAISSLDVSVGAQILNLLGELHEKLGLSVLFISHNIDAVRYLCSRIVRLEDGIIQ